MADELRKITTDTLRSFLTSDVDNVTYFTQVYNEIKQIITDAL